MFFNGLLRVNDCMRFSSEVGRCLTPATLFASRWLAAHRMLIVALLLVNECMRSAKLIDAGGARAVAGV
jgi:hypothetical protein